MANARSVIINLVANDRVSGALRDVGRQFDRLNDQMKRAAGPAMAATGAAAGGAFVAGIAGAIQLDSARGKLEAQLGLTKAKSKQVGDVAGKLYADAYGESMEEVQGAITSVIQNMDGMRTASSSALRETTARAMDVATVLDEEVGATTRAVAQMMRTGLAKNSQEAFDLLVAGAQRGANKAQDLLDTFNEYGTQFRKLGLDGKTAMGLIQQGLQGGARDADIVADAFKEFSIRAVDGSDSTKAGFKAIGLSASQTAAQIAAGGPTASKALDMVLDRLRAMKDPTEREAAAVALFGTQAEDLGKALFSLDPSKAVAALGQVGGAADKAGKALGETTASKFTAFKRSLQQDAMGALMATVGWFQQHTTIAKVLAGVIAALTAAYVAYNIVAGVMAARLALTTAGTTAHTIVTGIAAAATKTWAAVQWVLNAALSANPVSMIVIAIAALVAGVILAYRNSEQFRSIVQAAWAGIQMAVSFAWNSVIKPIFQALKSFVTGVLGPGMQFLWTIAKTVFTGITMAISAAWSLIRPIFTAITTVIRTVLSVAFVIFKNLAKAVWIAIQVVIRVAWLAIRSYFVAIKVFISNVLGPIFRWLLNNVIKPVWSGIRTVNSAGWNFLKAIFNAIRSYLSGTLGPAFRTFRTVATTAWNGLRSTISSVYNSGMKPIFNGLKAAVGAVRTAFGTAVNGIKVIWDKLKNIAKVPVNFVIGLYNKGIVGLVNGLARIVGIKTRLDKLPTFAGGGVMPGYAPGRDSLLAGVSPGEAIMRPEFTRAVGPGFVGAANAKARQGVGSLRKWLTGGGGLGGEGIAFSQGGIAPAPGFAGNFGFGGIVGGFIKGVKDFAIGNIAKAAKGLLGKIFASGIPGSGLIKDLIAGLPKWIIDSLLGWIKSKVSSGGGPGMERAMAFAKAQAGKPYVWGGVGPGGYDCSGFMSAIVNVIKGRSPYSRLFTTHSFGGTSGPGGFVRDQRSGFMVGVTDDGVGHMAGTLLNKSVESSGSAGVRVGGGARGAGDGMFVRRYGLKADTGALMLRPGWNPPTFNGTGRPELLTTPHPGSGNTYHINVNVPPGADLRQAGTYAVKAIQEFERRNGKSWRA